MQINVRWIEFSVLFIGLPILGYTLKSSMSYWLIPGLLILAFFCLYLVLQDPAFKRFRLTNAGQVKPSLKRNVPVFLVGFLLCVLFFMSLSDAKWFAMPIEATDSWVLLLIFYPLVSVLPQELIFRTYFFHRYKKLMPDKRLRIIISALIFSLAHIIYDNWIAMVLSFFGGLLFAYTYARTRSTLACIIEHSIWGLWLFTLGLGEVFDGGALL